MCPDSGGGGAALLVVVVGGEGGAEHARQVRLGDLRAADLDRVAGVLHLNQEGKYMHAHRIKNKKRNKSPF